ncbi:unnamed protein product [Discula destructiva]
MRCASALLSAALVAGVSAHTRIWTAWVNGVDQGDGRTTYVRSPPNNSPVKDMASPELVCNVGGATPAAGFVSAAAGDTVSLEWYHDNRGDDIIDGTHKGPITTYIAQYFEDAGTTAKWTKIQESGYDATTKTWAIDRLKSNSGKADFTLPANMAAGKYIVRQEIIALHEADACYDGVSRGAQFYPACVQFEITGSGTAVPDQGFDFNAAYSCQVPGIKFNLYSPFTDYPIPGPEVQATLGGTVGSDAGTGAGEQPSVPIVSSAAAAPTVASPTTASLSVATTPTAVPTTAVPTTASPTTATPTVATPTAATSPSMVYSSAPPIGYPVASAPVVIAPPEPSEPSDDYSGCKKRPGRRSRKAARAARAARAAHDA